MISAVDLRPRERTEPPRIPWRLPVRHFSASSLAMAATCPEQYRQRYIRGVREKTSGARLLGSAVHGALAINFDQKQRTGIDLSESDIAQAYGEAWDKETKKATEGIEWKTDPNETHAKGLQMATLYLAEVAPRIQPLAVEQEFRERLIAGLPPLVGYIDLVTEQGMVDYKTSAKKISQAKPGWRLQARIYQAVRPVDFSWHILTKTIAPQVFTPLEAAGLWLPYSEKAIDSAKGYIHDLAWTLNYYYVALGEDRPWPTTGTSQERACIMCSFRDVCPAWRV